MRSPSRRNRNCCSLRIVFTALVIVAVAIHTIRRKDDRLFFRRQFSTALTRSFDGRLLALVDDDAVGSGSRVGVGCKCDRHQKNRKCDRQNASPSNGHQKAPLKETGSE